MTIPRRIPPNDVRRLNTSLAAHASLSGRGTVRSARPVPPGAVHGVMANPDTGGSTGSIIYGEFWDPTDYTGVSDITFNPSELVTSYGSIGDYASYGAGGTGGKIDILADGWYQIGALAEVQGLASGGHVHVSIGPPTGHLQWDGWALESGGFSSCTVTALPDYYNAGDAITASVSCSSDATIHDCSVVVTYLGS